MRKTGTKDNQSQHFNIQNILTDALESKLCQNMLFFLAAKVCHIFCTQAFTLIEGSCQQFTEHILPKHSVGRFYPEDFKVSIIPRQEDSCNRGICLVVNKDNPIINHFKNAVTIPISFRIFMIYRPKRIKVLAGNLSLS